MPYTLAHTWANTKSSKKWDFEKKKQNIFFLITEYRMKV